jgi:hypothetical protein
MNSKSSIWATNPDTVVQLEKLVKSGLSISQIAEAMTARFHITVTPGQVIGKIKRMKLSLRWSEKLAEKRAEALKKPPKPPPPPKLSTRPIRVGSVPVYNSRGLSQPQPPRPPSPPVLASAHPGYRLLELPDGGCMYEISEGTPRAVDMRFCGQPRYGPMYCEAHHKVTLAPAPKARIRMRMRV